jgi:hypothetical protein
VTVSIFFVGAIILVGLSKIKFGFDRDDCVDFTKKTRRISRFYIGGIDKSCSSEESMHKFLLDRNIHVTFLRYFYRPSRGTAAAQLNVNNTGIVVLVSLVSLKVLVSEMFFM